MSVPDWVPCLTTVIVGRAKDRGLDVDDLATRVGVAPLELVSVLMSGNFTVGQLAQIAEALRTTPVELVEAAQMLAVSMSGSRS